MTYNTVPKSITRIQEEWKGFPVRYVLLVLVFAGLAIILTALTLLSGSKIFFGILLIILLAVFIVFFRSPAIMERSWQGYLFLIRSLRGETLIPKYALPDGFLERIIPIRAFHPDGLIEFAGNKYGLLMRIEPSRISDDEIDSHIQKVKGLIDSLHGEMLLKFFVCSVAQDSHKLERNVINIINTEDRTKEQKEHLYSIYHKVHESTNTNTNSVIQWVFYVFAGLGAYKTLNEAVLAKQQYFPGLEERLQRAGILVMPIKEHNSLASAYRTCITQSVYS